MNQGRFLLISDLQIPFEHKDARGFCKQLRKDYGIPAENIYCLGDETDQYFGSLFDTDPDAEHTPSGELDAARSKLMDWYIAFPKMRLAISNHGTRYWRKALAAKIPQQLLKSYQEVIKAPPGWEWKKHWLVKAKYPFLIEHGDDWGGQYPHMAATLHNGVSTAMGHHHSIAGVEYRKTNGYQVWGAAGGSLIDFERYAFNYARQYKFKPKIGCLVVLDDGKKCVFEPLE